MLASAFRTLSAVIPRAPLRSAVSVVSVVSVLSAMSLVIVAACGSTTPPPETPSSRVAGGGAEAPSDFKVPGECVDPVADGDTHDPTRPFDKHVQIDVRDHDLEGDGVVDIFVKPAWDCGLSCNRSVYIARGTCGHYLGTFPSTDDYQLMDTRSGGLRDILTRPRKYEEDGALHCYQVVLRFDGKEYKPSRRRECECKDTGAKCAAWDGS